MDHSVTTKRLVFFSILLLLLAVPPAIHGQADQAAPAANAEQIQALQKKLDALQSQMGEVQDELQRFSGGTSPPSHVPADIGSAIVAEQQATSAGTPSVVPSLPS